MKGTKKTIESLHIQRL